VHPGSGSEAGPGVVVGGVYPGDAVYPAMNLLFLSAGFLRPATSYFDLKKA